MGRDIGSGEKEGREKRGKEEKVGGAVVRERETEADKPLKKLWRILTVWTKDYFSYLIELYFHTSEKNLKCLYRIFT